MSKYIINHMKALVEEYNTRDPYELADAEGIVIISEPLEDGYEGGFFQIEEGKAIIINDNLDEIKKTFVVAHELLHATIHNNKEAFIRKNNRYEKDKILEIEANIFAVELLVDEDFFRNNEGRTIEELAKVTEMPKHMIAKKYEEILKSKQGFYN